MELTFAIDYGHRRVGTAVSAGFHARPLEVLPHGELDSLVRRLLELAHHEQATRIVVGLPRNADGSEGEQATLTRAFASRLAAESPLPVLLWDEYGSTARAQQQLIASGRRRKGRRERLDAVAAALLLQDFVERGPEGAERVRVEEVPDERPDDRSGG